MELEIVLSKINKIDKTFTLSQLENDIITTSESPNLKLIYGSLIFKQYYNFKNQKMNDIHEKYKKSNILIHDNINIEVYYIPKLNNISYKLYEYIEKIYDSTKNYYYDYEKKEDKKMEKYQIITDEDLDILIDNVDRLYIKMLNDNDIDTLALDNLYYIIKNDKLPNESEIIFLGDYHSSVHALIETLQTLKHQKYFNEKWELCNNIYLVCMGDMIDRGPYGIEILYILYSIFYINNQENNYKVVILNGNHEKYYESENWDFNDEINEQIKNDTIKNKLIELIKKLPVALFTKKTDQFKYLQFCHGGIDIHQETDTIKKILTTTDNTNKIYNLDINIAYVHHNKKILSNGFLWSDFSISEKTDRTLDRPNFNLDDVRNILDYNNIYCIISGHQDVTELGLLFEIDGRSPKFKNHALTRYIKPGLRFHEERSYDLYTFKTLENIETNDLNNSNFKSEIINLNTDKIYAITISSAVIPKYVRKAMWGIVEQDYNISINWADTCNFIDLGKQYTTNTAELCEDTFNYNKLLDRIKKIVI